MAITEGYRVRHLPCRHERVVDAPSVELAVSLDAGLYCPTCDTGEPSAWELPDGAMRVRWSVEGADS